MERSISSWVTLAAVGLMLMVAFAVPTVSGARAASLSLVSTGDDYAFAAPNGTAEFSLTVSNDGDVDFTAVNLSVSFDGTGWDAAVVDMSGGGSWNDSSGVYTIALAQAANDAVTITVTVPGDLNPGATVTMTVNATGDDGPYTLLGFDIRVANWRIWNEDGTIAYAEGESHDFTIKVENLATNETGVAVAFESDITIELSGADPGWEVSGDVWDLGKTTIYGLTAGQTLDIVATVNLTGENVEAGSASIFFSAYDDADYYSDGVTLSAQVAPFYRVTGSSGVTTITVDADGGYANWSVTIKNMGNTADTFTLDLDTTALGGWAITPGSVTTTGSLPWKGAGGQYLVDFSVVVPSGLAAGTSGSFTFTATSVGNSSQVWTETFTAEVGQKFGVDVSAASTAITKVPGETAEFTITVTNAGNGDDTYDITVDGAWNPSLSPTTLTDIAADGSGTTVLSVTVPADKLAADTSGEIIVTATSSDGETFANVTVAVSTGQTYGLTVAYFVNATDEEVKSAIVKQSVSKTLKVVFMNDGNGLDTVTLALVDGESWMSLPDPATVPISPDGTATVTVTLAPGTSVDPAVFTFKVKATSSDGTTTATSGDLTVTVTEKGTIDDPPPDKPIEPKNDPGFGLLALLGALGVALILRRR